MIEKLKNLDEESQVAFSKSFLADLPDHAIDQMLDASLQISAPAGSTIYEPGQAASIGLITSGLIRMYMSSPDGRQITVRYARQGDVIGLPALIGHEAPIQTQLVTNAKGIAFRADTLLHFAQHDASVSWRLNEELTRRIFELLEALAGHSFATLREKVAWHLLEMAAKQQQGNVLVAGISQQELADAVGSVRQVVARTLRDLRTAKLIETHADGISILKPQELHEQAWKSALSQK